MRRGETNGSLDDALQDTGRLASPDKYYLVHLRELRDALR